jgi:Flp pilus assembly protein TadD
MKRRQLIFLLLGPILLLGCGGGEEEEKSDSTPVLESDRLQITVGSEQVLPGDPRLSDLEFLRGLPPSADVEIAIGNVFLGRGEIDSALTRYQSATRRNPESVQGWNLVGICLGRADRLEEAEAAYRKAIEIDAFYAKSHINLGNIHLRRSELKEAIQAYKVATAIDSTDAQAWLNLGLAYAQNEQVNPAILAYGKAAECDPKNPEPWERLGWIYYENELYKGARDRWAEAVARDPSREDLRENIRVLEAWAESTGTR